MSDWRLSSGTDEFRQAERDHANGRGQYVPPMERVIFRDGPLSGLERHVLRGDVRRWFKSPLSDSLYLYEWAEPGVWRYAE